MSGIEVVSRTQRLVVNPAEATVSVINAGPPGPTGPTGPPGPPGDDAETSIGTVMEAHVNSPTPHPAYDDMPDLTILLENGLF